MGRRHCVMICWGTSDELKKSMERFLPKILNFMDFRKDDEQDYLLLIKFRNSALVFSSLNLPEKWAVPVVLLVSFTPREETHR